MKYETKLSLQIFTLGAVILLFGYYSAYRYNYKSIMKMEFEYTSSIVDELSVNFEQRLLEKVKTNQTLSTSPILKNKLIESNNFYGNYSDKERDEIIKLKNNRWKSIKDENDAFILEFTNNELAQFLKEHQKKLAGEYGEIFLTNKYGVIIASTSKLSTLAHAHKYWWQGAYDKGKGLVFFDDRGYDESAGGYVLGVVIPIKKNNEIIGILKVNLNILGSIGEMLSGSKNTAIGEFKLVRSGGEIIFDNQGAPLSHRIPDLVCEKIQTDDKDPFIFEDSIDNWMIGMSEITITSKNVEDFRFGGSFESIDHVKGNTGESWFIINYRNIDSIVKPLKNYTFTILAIGFLLIIIMAIVALVIGKLTVNPLKQLIEQSRKIAKADFSSRIEVTRKDEIGLLGTAFNKMTIELERNTTSIKNLESEISQRLKAEQELKEQNEEYAILNREYRTINEELIGAKDKAEESDRLKLAFLANMSHEIRTPMNGILGFINLLNEPDLSKGEIEEYSAVINRGGERLLTTINDIIDISRIESGEMVVSKEETSINRMMDELYSFFLPEVKRKGLSLLYKSTTEQLTINTDSHKLHGILTNLIKNAIKFTEEGSITFGYVLKKDRDTNEQGGSAEVELFVKDTGTGIPKDRIQAIFKRFEQADIEDVRALEGSGLGLAISTAYIEMLGGEIFVESEQGKGSKFTFTIPYVIPNINEP